MPLLSLISWNMSQQVSNWEAVLKSGADVALLLKLETATRQLDFVFASESIAKRLNVRAANRKEEWGPSDHCKVFIELYPDS